MVELKDNLKESEFEKISKEHKESMEELIEPRFCGRGEIRAKNSILIGSIAYRVYSFLKENSDKAFTSNEIAKAINEKNRLVVYSLHEMKKGFILSSGFKINIRREGYPSNSAALYSQFPKRRLGGGYHGLKPKILKILHGI
ncbi:hypothetical protein KEJ25_10375 [Candidatus Bathyarchaeota archaeon]|nr:hypothetical protein [Candidatus Bathyarchaeota archaeon]